MADRDGNAVLNGHRDRLNVRPLVDGPIEVFLQQVEVVAGDLHGGADLGERIGKDERGASILTGDWGERFEGGAIGIDLGSDGLERLDDRLVCGERIEVSPEPVGEIVADAPLVTGGGAEEAEARST